MAFSSVSVVANALRLRRFRSAHGDGRRRESAPAHAIDPSTTAGSAA